MALPLQKIPEKLSSLQQDKVKVIYANVLDIIVRGILLLTRFWQSKWQSIRIE